MVMRFSCTVETLPVQCMAGPGSNISITCQVPDKFIELMNKDSHSALLQTKAIAKL